jgi:hypothetical protein
MAGRLPGGMAIESVRCRRASAAADRLPLKHACVTDGVARSSQPLVIAQLGRMPASGAANPNLEDIVMVAARAKRILVLAASAGAGHVRAVQAIERAFHQADSGAEVRHIDTPDYAARLFRKLYGRAYIDLVNKPPRPPEPARRPARQAISLPAPQPGVRQAQHPLVREAAPGVPAGHGDRHSLSSRRRIARGGIRWSSGSASCSGGASGRATLPTSPR